MKRLSLILVLLTFTLHARADEASRRAKAKEMIALLHMDRVMTQMMDGIKQQMTAASQQMLPGSATTEQQRQLEAFQQKIFSLVESQMSWKTLEPEFIDLYVKDFTEEELDGIVTFYKSPVGASLIAKMPELSSQGMQIAQKRIIAIQPQIKQLAEEFAKSVTPPPPPAPPKPPTP